MRGLFTTLLFLLGFSSVAQVDTLYSYTEIRGYAGSADTLFLSQEDREGLFVRTTDLVTFYPNAGSIINSATNDKRWVRQIIDKTYQPEWWDERVNYKSYPLQAAIDFSCNGCIIKLKDSTTYTLDRHIFIQDGRTLRGGDESVIKRRDLPVTTLKSPANLGDSMIIVESTDGYLIGQDVIMIDDNSPDLGKSTYDNNISYFNFRPNLIAINEDTLFLSRGITMPLSGRLDDAFPAGTTVFPTAIMMFNNVGHDSITIENVIFDGNQQHLNYDWRILNTLGLGGSVGHTIYGCTFRNTPSENITVSGSTVVDSCFGFDLGGSFFHVSSPGGFSNSTVQNSYVHGSCLNTNVLSGHSEGTIAYSSYVQDLYVLGNTFKNGKEGVLGWKGSDDRGTYVRDNTFQNHKFIIQLSNSTDTIHDVVFDNNIFDSCGYIYSTSLEGKLDGFIINHNSMINSGINLKTLVSIQVDSNTFSSTLLDTIIGINAEIIDFTNNTVLGVGAGLVLSSDSPVQGTICSNIMRVDKEPIVFENDINFEQVVVQGNAIENSSIDYGNINLRGNIFWQTNANSSIDIEDNSVFADQESFETQLSLFEFQGCQDAILPTTDIFNRIAVQPNPASGKISVITEWDAFNIEIYSQSGILIQKNFAPTNALEMDISDLLPGLYLFRISNESEYIIKKVIVR